MVAARGILQQDLLRSRLFGREVVVVGGTPLDSRLQAGGRQKELRNVLRGESSGFVSMRGGISEPNHSHVVGAYMRP